MKGWWRQYEARRAEQQELVRLSYHESGHAIAVFISPGVEITRVILGRDSNSLNDLDGHCEWRASAGVSVIDPWTRLIVSLCGPASDLAFFGLARTGEGDRVIARRVAEQIAAATGGDLELILARAGAEAVALVRRYADAIKTLAGALLSRRELSGKDVDTCLAGCVPREGDPMSEYARRVSAHGRLSTGPSRRSPEPIVWRTDGCVG